MAWLRAPADNVIVFDDTATVNRHLAALFGFCDLRARSGGVGVAAELVAWRRGSRGSCKPFLRGIASDGPVRLRPVGLRVPRRLPAVLGVEEVAVILAACTRLRDRFLFALLAETGMRVGQALGLGHEDFVSRRREVRIVARADNANGARAKCLSPATVPVPVSAPLVRLWGDCMHTEYGALDSDCVFVNLWSAPVGRPLRCGAVAKLVRRLRARTGIEFAPHTLRRSRATELIRAGVAIEIVSKLLTHRSAATTSAAYVHLDVEDLRAELVRAGAWDDISWGAPSGPAAATVTVWATSWRLFAPSSAARSSRCHPRTRCSVGAAARWRDAGAAPGRGVCAGLTANGGPATPSPTSGSSRRAPLRSRSGPAHTTWTASTCRLCPSGPAWRPRTCCGAATTTAL